MKRKIFLAIIAFLTLSLTIFSPFEKSLVKARASDNLDEILKYEVTVKPRQDATLDITYRLKWKVLDSDSDGPLTWVKIGVANMYVDEIKPLGDCIKNAKYYYDDGAYVRIDFKKKYYKDEVVDFGFSVHQSRIFSFDGSDKSKVTFAFVPGWFTEIRVDEMILRWDISGVKSEDIIYCSGKNTDGTYAEWTVTNMHENQKLQSKIKYNRSVFPSLDENATYSDKQATSGTIFLKNVLPIIVIVAVFGLIIAIVLIAQRASTDEYYRYRGFSGPYYHWWIPFRSGVNSKGKTLQPPTVTGGKGGGFGSGGGCACACACACAGGGRAGCSRKDFTTFPEYAKLKDTDVLVAYSFDSPVKKETDIDEKNDKNRR